MARRRKQHTGNTYNQTRPGGSDRTGGPGVTLEDLSPRARRLVESGLIDLDAVIGSGDGGRITSGDILHAARLMEKEQHLPRIENTRMTDAGPTSPGSSAGPVEIGDGLSASALRGAEISWGEAAAGLNGAEVPLIGESAFEPELQPSDGGEVVAEAPIPDPETDRSSEVVEPAAVVEEATGEATIDFGTLEFVDPNRVWENGGDSFAPWLLAHSDRIADLLGVDSGLGASPRVSTSTPGGVVGRDGDGNVVVMMSSRKSVAESSDLGRALGMAAEAKAARVAVVSAEFNAEQRRSISWLNECGDGTVGWFGIELRVMRIDDSPPAMLFDLVAGPGGKQP